MINQKEKAKILSGVLLSSTLFLFNQAEVHALTPTSTSPSPSPSVPVTSNSTPVAPSTTTNSVTTSATTPSTNTVSPAPTVSNQTYTGDKPLDSVITNASSQGISVVEAPESTVPTTSAKQTDYNNQTTIVTDVTKQYVADKAVYASQDKAYQDYLAKQAQYQKDLASYQAYLKAKAVYDQQMKVYNTAKANYDMAYNQALANTNKTGYLPEVLAQNLIFRLEPNATQTITGKLLSDADLAKATKNSVGWIDPGTVIGNPKLATITTKNKWNSALVSVGESVVVDYTGLENSSFSGHALTHVRYTYKLISTTHYSGKVVFQAIADPTETSYTHIYNKDGETRSSFEFQLTVQLFDAQGNEMIPTASNYALTSFASLNSRNGNGEYVSNYNGRFIPINGSTISVENGKAANFSSTDQATTIAGWDDKNSPDAYIGAIVGQSTDRISFNFGNTHGFADWFAFNSDVKTSGGIVTPPILPTAPKEVAKPIKPTAVAKPSVIPTPIIFYHKVRVVAPPAKTSKPLKIIPTYITSPTTYHYSPVLYYFAPPVKNYGTIYRAPVIVNPKVQETEKNDSSTKISKPRTKYIDHLTNKEIDWLRRNIGKYDKKKKDYNISRDDIHNLISYLEDVKKMAIKKYGKNSHNEINHALANAVSGINYAGDKSQKFVNDFDTVNYKKSKYFENAKKIINNSHQNKYKLDLSHMMMPISTSYESKWWKEVIKTVMTFPSLGNNKDDTFFWLNSLTGDKYTNIDKIDKDSDNDAYVLRKNTNGRTNDLLKNFINLYNKPYDRSKTYSKMFNNNPIISKTVEFLSSELARATLGMVAILALTKILMPVVNVILHPIKTIKSRYKKFITKTSNSWNTIKDYFKKLIDRATTSNVYADEKTVKKHKTIIKSTTRKTKGKQTVKPVIKRIQVYVKPVVKRVQRYVKPVVKRVQRYVKPVTRAVKKYSKPVVNFVKKFFGKGRKHH